MRGVQMEIGWLWFILVSVLFSLVYGKIESGLDKFWTILGRDGGPFWGKLLFGTKWTPYHVALLVLDTIVCIPSLLFTHSISFFVASVLIFPLLEDAAYFWWLRKWIKPTDWTAKEGSVTIKGVTVPYWYFLLGAVIWILLWIS